MLKNPETVTARFGNPKSRNGTRGKGQRRTSKLMARFLRLLGLLGRNGREGSTGLQGARSAPAKKVPGKACAHRHGCFKVDRRAV